MLSCFTNFRTFKSVKMRSPPVAWWMKISHLVQKLNRGQHLSLAYFFLFKERTVGNCLFLQAMSSLIPGQRVEVNVVTEMMMVQLRSLPLHEKWSQLHHQRRMFGCAGHSRIKAYVTMILRYASNDKVSVLDLLKYCFHSVNTVFIFKRSMKNKIVLCGL